MARKELTDDQLEVHRSAIASSIRRDLLTKDVSYQDAADMKYLASYRRENSYTKTEVRRILREEHNASIVSVGGNKVAIVRRKDN
jgi:hypothetical protein